VSLAKPSGRIYTKNSYLTFHRHVFIKEKHMLNLSQKSYLSSWNVIFLYILCRSNNDNVYGIQSWFKTVVHFGYNLPIYQKMFKSCAIIKHKLLKHILDTNKCCRLLTSNQCPLKRTFVYCYYYYLQSNLYKMNPLCTGKIICTVH
jgi:hypothetical protein